MRGTISIGNKDVEMAANAATPFIYKQTFHEDLLLQLQAKEPSSDLVVKLGFVMAKQAELPAEELMKIKETEFYSWVEQFEFMDFVGVSKDIFDLYTYQTVRTSVPKNEGV